MNSRVGRRRVCASPRNYLALSRRVSILVIAMVVMVVMVVVRFDRVGSVGGIYEPNVTNKL